MKNQSASTRLDKGKLSSTQLGLIFLISIMTTGIMAAPSPVYAIAGRDFWLALLLGSLPAYGMIFVVHRLHRQYPNMTFIEYVTQVYGKVIGKIIGVLFLLYILHMTGIAVRQFCEFMTVGFFTRTPLTVIAGVIIFTSSWAVRGGVETIGRFAQIFAPAILILMLLVIVPLTPDFNLKELFPVMEHGLLPPIKGSILLQQWFLIYSLTSFFLPYVSDSNKSQRASMLSLTFLVFVMIIGHMSTVLLLGEVTGLSNFSFTNLSRYIKVTSFFEHLQSLVMTIWVISLFIRLNTTYYIVAIGTAQLLALSDYRLLVMPIGLLILIFTFWSIPSITDYISALPFNTFYFMTVLGMLPLLTWFVSCLRLSIKKII
ncbi:endospore germination permease [Paenibacillus sp. GCM10012307]|uniref:Endospore germination permease n=1 Tax=Paenibacillus roseus TaxID=2798579 RepID=A0A934J6V1_9BACL|nr:endospore germination permease [Paenibacillus roseus]MBJ6361460.1 endospore germination permease [Paenibacillus roseus]